ncbi:putative quinol monooxygenase [Cupriavidus sp. 30B13]|uniref:putative quinol monooxygenase n=1 Tax=Cupriavidus sp. 30B13 TaxID=3384241 RepID=UPI003B8F3353
MNSPLKVVAVLTAKEGREVELETLLRGLTAPSRAESGNLRYDLWRDIENPRQFVLDELYQDEAAIDSHRATGHFQDYRSRIGDLAERMAVVVRPVDVDGA